MDMNSVVEHGITGAGVALLFLGIGWAWQILGYPIRRILGYLNQMLFITDLPAPKRFGSINGHQAFKEQRTRVGSLLGFCLFAFLGASVALMMPQTVQADSNGRNDSDARNSDGGNALWPSAGQNLNNTGFQSAEHGIGVENASTLAVKWQFTTMGDVSATPAVDDDKVYFPDWGGYLYAVNRKTGAQVWQTKIEWQTGVAGDKARATPAVAGNKVIVGTQGGPTGGGGKLLAYDKNTGALLWKTTLDPHFAAAVTQSASVHGNTLYVGLASLEEGLAAFIPGYVCCSFRGSMIAIDVNTGAIIWKTYMVPPGYSGGAIWGSSPAIDTRRGQVYIATGNNYSVPASVLTCVGAAAGDPGKQGACLSRDDLFDAVVALDLKSGAVRWAHISLPYDAWTVDCIPFVGSGSNCPMPAGPDYDFGQAPALFSVPQAGKDAGHAGQDGDDKPRELVGAGQKSGIYWALNPDNGAVVWKTQAGPGGSAGGLQWGSAADGKRIYTANANSDRQPWMLPNGTTTTEGVWSALDIATGHIIWQVTPLNKGSTSGPVTTANGVVFGCSLDPLGYMYAMNAVTGTMLWRYPSGGSCLSGAAISRGAIYWGSGYSRFGTPNNKVYAFEVTPKTM
jgi:polyvinyl alcohol dehydrogenase (cytochrome)